MDMKIRSIAKHGLAVCAVLFLSFSFLSCKKMPRYGKEGRVLFIGNSLTSVNNLP